MPRNWTKFFILTSILFFSLAPLSARLATIEELRNKIESRNAEIKKLEAAISIYQTELSSVEREATSLRNEILRLDKTSDKLAADIAVTDNKIVRTDLTIEKLTLEIGMKNKVLITRRSAIQELLKRWHLRQDESLLELFVVYERLSDAWLEISAFSALENSLRQDINLLAEAKKTLENSQVETQTERETLAALTEKLRDQRQLAQGNLKQKDRLLVETKNEEANYKKLLNESIARRDAFEKEVFSLESELQIAIDPKLLPPPRAGVLIWPLESVTVTQEFGQTVDAKRLYISGTHNGIDLRASPGTPVKAAAGGEVTASGDTDLACAGASYGKWVLLKHTNGLSTLYAHLSLIKVAAGHRVQAGETVGYSGNTGYSTGPHLHFTVFATQGMRLREYQFRSCTGAKVIMPLADLNAYLDPMLYL